jgi:glycosyltransferase involved in cell wall biosynthesis
VPEVVTDGEEGLLVPARDPAALGDALSILLHNPEFRKAAGARAVQTARGFDMTRAVRRIEEVYREALQLRRESLPG